MSPARSGFSRTHKVIAVLVVIPFWYFFIRPLAGQILSDIEAPRAAPAAASVAAPPNRNDATAVDPRMLAAEPSAYNGRNLTLYGRALNVEQRDTYTWVQLMAQVPERAVTESIVVELSPKSTAVLKDECYRIFGVGAGTQDITRTLTGASGKAPLLKGYAVESTTRTASGCAA